MNPNFERKELFYHYHANSNPFIIVTIPIDVTNIVRYCKKYKNFYATIGYLVAKSANQLDAFKWRYENGEFHYYPELIPNFTQKLNDEKIGYFDCEYQEDYEMFLKNYQEVQEKFYIEQKSITTNSSNAIWLSCNPWFSITSLVPPFDKENTIPQFIWDKYEEENEKYHLHLMILVHHGFADGYHISKFLEILKNEIDNFQRIERL